MSGSLSGAAYRSNAVVVVDDAGGVFFTKVFLCCIGQGDVKVRGKLRSISMPLPLTSVAVKIGTQISIRSTTTMRRFVVRSEYLGPME